jgi:hypothetical protein
LCVSLREIIEGEKSGRSADAQSKLLMGGETAKNRKRNFNKHRTKLKVKFNRQYATKTFILNRK